MMMVSDAGLHNYFTSFWNQRGQEPLNDKSQMFVID